MSELAGFILVYGIPAALAALFWFGPIRRLINTWDTFTLMDELRPKPEHVHHTERIMGITRNRT